MKDKEPTPNTKVKDMVKKIFGEEASNDPDILFLYEDCTKQAIEEQVNEKLKEIREEIEEIPTSFESRHNWENGDDNKFIRLESVLDIISNHLKQ